MKAPQLFCGALALAMSVSACQNRTSEAELKQKAGETADRIKTESVKAGDKLEDVWLATKIQGKFVGDRDIKARDVKVSASDGVVTLNGHVLNESEHQLALTLAKNTDGVKQVIDNLDVEVAGPPPARAVNGGTPGAAATTGDEHVDALARRHRSRLLTMRALRRAFSRSTSWTTASKVVASTSPPTRAS